MVQTDEQYYALFDWHHIITDGISINILIYDFTKLYEGQELPDLKVQYKDFAIWHNQLLQSEIMNKQEEFWLNEFLEERTGRPIPVMNLPIDFKRPVRQSYEGNRFSIQLGLEWMNKLHALAKEEGTTLYVVLLAAYNVILAKLSGQDDIIIGTPIAGRSHPDLEKIIGMFVNTLVLRNYPEMQKTFREFLREVKERALLAFENQDYQFEVLVDQLNLSRDLSRNPLFDTMFRLQNFLLSEEINSELEYSPCEFETNISQFDLLLSCAEESDGLKCTFEYCTKLFKQETVEKIADYYVCLIQNIIDNPDQKLAELEILLSEEKERLLIEFNNTEFDYQKEKTIYELFEDQVIKTPENIALISKGHFITYRELNERSNQLARFLRTKGVGRETIIGIMLQRSIEMIIGLLGVLKAGGAYLPIDPEYPLERYSLCLKIAKQK